MSNTPLPIQPAGKASGGMEATLGCISWRAVNGLEDRISVMSV